MTWTDRGFVNVTLGTQGPSHSLETSSNFDLYDEQGLVETNQDVAGGAFFDISGGYKVWRNLAVGLGFTRIGSDADVAVSARIPDPLVTDRLRSVSAATTAEHSEFSTHLTGTWMMPVTDKIDVGFSFGPTIFQVSQDVPTSISVSEPGPTVSSTSLTRAEKTTVGFHAGVDATYLITPRIGAGALLRFSRGSAALEGATEELTVGGLQFGVGVRLRF